jgi:hypothetical protein
MTMKQTASCLLLSLFLLPALAEAQSIYAPCKSLTGAEQISCRRTEVLRFLREVNRHHNRENIESAKNMRNIHKDLTQKQKDFYSKKTTQVERDAFREGLKSERLKKFHDWKVVHDDLLRERREIRKLVRKPGNRELRMSLVQQRGEFRESLKGVQKKSKRVIIQEALERIRKTRDGK